MTAHSYNANQDSWPELPLEAWQDTYATLHMWTQIVGKVRLALSPRLNHWWEVPLYVSARGLTTSAIPYEDEVFEVQFDFIEHELIIHTSWGASKRMALEPRSVADFHAEFMSALRALGIEVKIWTMPVEVPNPVRFEEDTQHASYDREYAHRFWKVLVLCDSIFKEFRAGFIGKDSPVHFFWGSFDLCVTRFSGRRAPERADADSVTREAYSHEVISAGFWPGNGGYGAAAFYCYAAPVPEGLAEVKVRPDTAGWDKGLGEFIFRYDALLKEASPEKALMEFLESTYGAAADVARWDRAALERR
jgi:hypothetical protein